jgi:hypothetical protein
LSDWPLVYTLFGDRLPKEGESIMVSHDDSNSRAIMDDIGMVINVAPAGDHCYTVYTEKHREGVEVGRLWRWRPVR